MSKKNIKRGKWIKFVLVGKSVSKKTQIWNVIARDVSASFIGQIKWFGRWRQYAFFPDDNTVYENVCLKDIANFIEGLTEARKHK